jgi:class 3 adenylate cyclase
LEERHRFYDTLMREWGGPAVLDLLATNAKNDDRFCHWWAGYLRRSASPGAALALTQMNTGIDIRHILPSIRVPTLVLHRTGDPLCPVEGGRYIAAHIPDATLVELPGIDHLPFVGDVDALVDPIQEFLTGAPPVADSDRVLTTILLVDIVDSTGHAVRLGDNRWRALLDVFRMVVRRELERFHGDERTVTGDGFVATFDGPGRAIRCAMAIVDAVRALGIEVRAGLHTGECTLRGTGIEGIAVHIADRIASHAGASEVIVSSVVKDLVIGSRIRFDNRGRHALKGMSGMWQLFAVAGDEMPVVNGG